LRTVKRDEKGRVVEIVEVNEPEKSIEEYMRIAEEEQRKYDIAEKLHRATIALEKMSSLQTVQPLSFDPTKIKQKMLVPAGQSAIVYEYVLKKSMVALIDMIGCTWYPQTFYYFYVDNSLKEKVARIIGDLKNPIGRPLSLSRPIMVTRRITWKAVNNDVKDHEFEVLCDGRIYLKSDLPFLDGLQVYGHGKY